MCKPCALGWALIAAGVLVGVGAWIYKKRHA
jgi:hypothetical protein